MKVVATRSTQHLIGTIGMPTIDYTIKTFSDGELYIKLNDNVQDETVWVLAGTQAPAENMLELLFLLDALTHAGAQTINLFCVYFAYARQTQADSNEARSAQVICNTLKQFKINQTYILHAHAVDALHQLLEYKNIIDFEFFYAAAQEVDIIAAPDQGAADCARELGQKCNKEVIVLEKKRPEHEKVIIENVSGSVVGKKILIIDDMISTGRTLLHAAQALKDAGAMQISAAATHGLCDKKTYQELAKVFEKVSVTNSIAQENIPGVKIWDIRSFIKTCLQEQ